MKFINKQFFAWGALGISLLSGSAANAANCATPEWTLEPALQDDCFVARLLMRCRIDDFAKPPRLEALPPRLRESIEAVALPAPWTLAPPPVPLKGAPGELTFYATLPLDLEQSSSSHDRLLQEVHLRQENRDRVVHWERSHDIQASGRNSYLRKVEFRSEIQAVSETAVELAVSSEIRVERPWYAPPSIFVAIAKSTTRSKFTRLAERYVDRVAQCLERPTP